MADQEPVRLFVSHHSSKYDVAQKVEALLAKRGVRCWIAPRDVPPGAPFDKAVHEAIEDSAAVLLLFCANSDKSRHVKRELILSDSAGRPIIPLRLEAIDPGDLAYHLADSQWVDWVDRREAVMDRVAAQARLYGNAAAELGARPAAPGAVSPSSGGGSNRNWYFAAIAGAVVAVLAIILVLVTRIGHEPATTNTKVATAAGPQGEPTAGQAAASDSQAIEEGPSEAKAPPPAAPRPAAPAVAADRSSPPPAEPVRSAAPPAPTPAAQAPLQRVVDACRGALTDTEYLICSDPALSRRAGEMGDLIGEIKARYKSLEQSPNAFNGGQRQWMNGVKASCHSAACVEAMQKERMQALRATLASLG